MSGDIPDRPALRDNTVLPDNAVPLDDPVLPDDPEDADPGLASERTALAWTRSSLAFAAVGVAIAKARPAIGIPVLAFSPVVLLLGHLPRARCRPGGHSAAWDSPGNPRAPMAQNAPQDGTRARSRRALLMVTGITMLAVAALVITLAGSGASGIRLR